MIGASARQELGNAYSAAFPPLGLRFGTIYHAAGDEVAG